MSTFLTLCFDFNRKNVNFSKYEIIDNNLQCFEFIDSMSFHANGFISLKPITNWHPLTCLYKSIFYELIKQQILFSSFIAMKFLMMLRFVEVEGKYVDKPLALIK